MLQMFTEALGNFIVASFKGTLDRLGVSFALPGAIPNKNVISLFLSSLAEDSKLRSNETLSERTPAFGWISKPPPLRLKCIYIVSAWPASDNPSESALTQSEMLATVYHILSSVGTLPAAYIPESMTGSDIPKPVLAISKDDLPNRPEFWTSMGCTFRPAFSLAATVALPSAEERYDHVVEGVKTDYKINSKQ